MCCTGDSLPCRRSGSGQHDPVAVRIGQLRRLGWTPVRVWTTEVFRDPAREVARLVHLARAASAERYAAAVATRRGGAHSPTEA